MKKGIFSISEKHERITIRYRRRRKVLFAVCEECRRQFDWLTVKEAAKLTGKDSKEIRSNLKILRRKEKKE